MTPRPDTTPAISPTPIAGVTPDTTEAADAVTARLVALGRAVSANEWELAECIRDSRLPTDVRAGLVEVVNALAEWREASHALMEAVSEKA